jgi:hypothetical protein
LGVLVINWNWCEFAQEFLIAQYLDLPVPEADLITRPMPNNTRGNLLTDLVGMKEKRRGLRSAIAHFQQGFGLCLENRNTLIHALGAPNEFAEGGDLVFVRQAKRPHQRDIAYPGEAELIGTVAKDVATVFSYGMKLVLCVARGKRQPLPRKPPLPGKLMPLPDPEAGQGGPRQRQSSRALSRHKRKRKPPQQKRVS